MIERVNDFFAGWKMTIVSGIFLAASFILVLLKIEVFFDPAWITVIISGFPLLYLAIIRLVKQRWVSSALLISIAMFASLAINELFAAGEVAFIMAIGALLEDMTVKRAKKGIRQMISLTPQQGRILEPDEGGIREKIVPIEEIRKGDTLRVLPGEVIPVDGKILYGTTSVDQSVMTGESLPVDKREGDDLFCGTMNCNGSVDIEAVQVGKDSSLQKLIDLVNEADKKQAPMQRIADKWATWLVPVALLIAVAAFIGTRNIERAVTVLVVFCPCALALATPVSIMAAIGQATKHGVLIKSGEALEKMGKVDCITFDKTGTLTYGDLNVTDVVLFQQEISETDLIRCAVSLEAKSEHPLGKAVVKYGNDRKIEIQENSDFQMIPGKGIRAVIDGKAILCGNTVYLEENGVKSSETAKKKIDELRSQGKATILIAQDAELMGAVALSDTLRPEAVQMVGKLKEMGTEAVLLTGDNSLAAFYMAKQVGIENIKSDLLPQDKVRSVEELIKAGKSVCMIGDGVNDAPALKTATVGVAMGSMGSDIAIEAADIALMSDNVEKILYLKKLSESTIRTIKGNITVSMCINFVAVTLSVLGVLNPVTGALVHNAGSCLVVLNAALLYDRKFN